MNEGDAVLYRGTLPNGPARVVEVGDGRAIIELKGVGRVECDVADLEPLWYANGGVINAMPPLPGEDGCALVAPTGDLTEQAEAGASYIKQTYGGHADDPHPPEPAGGNRG